MTMEEWRTVDGYPLYQVSSLGRVRSRKRKVNHYRGVKLARKGKVLKGTLLKGYLKVGLYRGLERAANFSVHTLVAAAFVGPRPPGLVVRHRDGDRRNNRAENILYGTSAENSEDRRSHGTLPMGESHGSAKLTTALVNRIRHEARTKTYAQLAASYGVSESQVGNIVTRTQWKHV